MWISDILQVDMYGYSEGEGEEMKYLKLSDKERELVRLEYRLENLFVNINALEKMRVVLECKIKNKIKEIELEEL